MYTVEGLKNGIKQCRNNKKLLKEAIGKEDKTIADYKAMINSIEEADKKKSEAEANIHIEVCR